MKKFLFLLMAGTMLCGVASADCNCDYKDCRAKMESMGGFVDATAKPVSLAEAQKLPDDSYVTIAGYITKQIKDDEYTFSDGTNSITVEIGRKDWRGLRVTPKDKIIIKGKVDKDFTSFKVDAKSISLAD